MTQDELSSLAEAFIEHFSRPYVWDKDMVLMARDRSRTEWAPKKAGDLISDDPDALWALMLEVLRRDPPADVIAVLAAGPLEQYLVEHGDNVIARVEAQASKDAKFRALLGGVWKRSEMSAELWARVEACCDRSGWTF